MTAARTVTYGECADKITANGFLVVPVAACAKNPVPDDWPNFKHNGNAAQYVKCSTGLICGRLSAIDIDVRDPVIAEQIDREAKKRFGDTMHRIGSAPKRVLLYRTLNPFAKIKSREYRFPGDDPGAKSQAVEILGTGQQVLAFGIHPDTRKPYTWGESDPINTRLDELLLITETQARDFVEWCDALLAAVPGVSKAGKLRSADDARQRAANDELRAKNPVQCREAIAAIKNDGLSYDDWIYVGLAIRGALGDCETARQSFVTFSAKSAKNDPALTLKQWATLKEPNSIGAGTLYELAKQAGWKPARVVFEPTIYNAERLRTMELPEQKVIVENLIVEGSTVIAGRPKRGKSRILMNIAAAIASDNGVAFGKAGVDPRNGRQHTSAQETIARDKPIPEAARLCDRMGKGQHRCIATLSRQAQGLYFRRHRYLCQVESASAARDGQVRRRSNARLAPQEHR
jgi:hypothetical protein